LKAYNQITNLAEKEIMQAFNYAMYGGKALLITTGTLKLSDIIPYHGSYEDLLNVLAVKYDNLAKEVDLSLGQDAFDSRGIYRSANEKLKKIQRHVNNWTPIDYELIKDPIGLKNFPQSKFRLGVVEPSAFEAALVQQQLGSEASLFDQIRSAYLEEIIVNPTILYP
jgi:hypothetical protein